MNRLAGLDAHAQRLAGTSLAALIEADPARARDFALRVGPLYANFARQRYDRIALDALFALAAEADLAGAIDVFYLSTRLRLLCFAIAQQSIYQAGNQLFMEKELVELVLK